MPEQITATRVLAIFVLVILLWLVNVAAAAVFNWSDLATIGDAFGIVNSLFSGLAFAGVLVALKMQQMELKLQRDELLATREELSLQREEMKRTADSQQKAESALAQQASMLFVTAYLDGLRACRDAANAATAAPSASRLRRTAGTLQAAKATALLREVIRAMEPYLDASTGFKIANPEIVNKFDDLDRMLASASVLHFLCTGPDSESVSVEFLRQQCDDRIAEIRSVFDSKFREIPAAARVGRWITDMIRKINDFKLPSGNSLQFRKAITQSSEELLDLLMELADSSH
ncbi:MAG: hypothetical protein U0941_13325 [Planctomycetaceae bacterium]